MTRRPCNPFTRPLLKSLGVSFRDNQLPLYGALKVTLDSDVFISMYSEDDDRIAGDLYDQGVAGFEPESLRTFLSLAKSAHVIFDIGANTGIYALSAARVSPRASVHAFEPVPKIFARLHKNRELNQIKNLTITEAAIAAEDGHCPLFIPLGDIPTSASTLKGFRPNVEVIEVATMSLDSYVFSRQLQSVDLIKIDTEATEHVVLHGARTTIGRFLPTIMCEVLSGRNERTLAEFLRDYGYRFFWITEKGLVEREEIVGDPSWQCKNWLFVGETRFDELSLPGWVAT